MSPGRADAGTRLIRVGVSGSGAGCSKVPAVVPRARCPDSLLFTDPGVSGERPPCGWLGGQEKVGGRGPGLWLSDSCPW